MMLCARVMCVSVCLRVTFVRTAGHNITPPLEPLEPDEDVGVPETPDADAFAAVPCAAGSGRDEDRRLTRSTYTDKHTHADTHTHPHAHTRTHFFERE